MVLTRRKNASSTISNKLLLVKSRCCKFNNSWNACCGILCSLFLLIFSMSSDLTYRNVREYIRSIFICGRLPWSQISTWRKRWNGLFPKEPSVVFLRFNILLSKKLLGMALLNISVLDKSITTNEPFFLNSRLSPLQLIFCMNNARGSDGNYF